jgi:hypothetical protein
MGKSMGTQWDGKTERRNGANHLKEIMEMKFAATQIALDLQAKEYERRLADLNNEAARLHQMQTTYLPREIYEAHHRELENKIDALQRICFIGMGVLLTVEFLFRLMK